MSSRELAVQDDSEPIKPSIIELQGEIVTENTNIISFNNTPLYEVDEPFPHYIKLTKERFDRIGYNLIPGGPSRSRMGDIYALISNRAPDLSHNSNLILFGRYDIKDGQEKPDNHPNSIGPSVWDTRTLETHQLSTIPANQCIWRSPYAKIAAKQMFSEAEDYPERIPFIMQLACGDTGVYDDIMQSIAPMIMDKKPDGVIWWVGDGANGKSTLMDALYRIFPGQLSSLTIHALSDKNDAPALNGQLANIVKESSEGRIDDTEVYKAIGTHENFTVHKFHSQDPYTIVGNIHHIFSGNSVPVFNDKGHSARRRTFVIPFRNQFPSDPTFEEKTFTPEFFGRLVAEMCKYAVRLRRQGYVYKFSDVTNGIKVEYDADVNTAEAYIKYVIGEGVVAFESFRPLQMDYDNWCADMGLVPLGRGHLTKAARGAGFMRDNKPGTKSGDKFYRLEKVPVEGLQVLGMGRPGLFTLPGFAPIEDPEPIVPDFYEPKKPETVPPDDDADSTYRPTKLKGEW